MMSDDEVPLFVAESLSSRGLRKLDRVESP